MKYCVLCAALLVSASTSWSQMKVIDDWDTPVTGDKPIKPKAPKDALPPDKIPDDAGPGPGAPKPVESRDLASAEKSTVTDLLVYMDGEIASLKKLQKSKGADSDLDKTIDRMQNHLVMLKNMTYRKAGAITNTLGPSSYAAYYSASPSSIYLTDKFFEPSAVLPFDDPAVAKARKQIYLGERLSLLIHELCHAGRVNYLSDRPFGKDDYNEGDTTEVRVRGGMGTGDKDCYLVQYYMLRVLTDQALADYKAGAKMNFGSAVFSMVLSQLRDLGVIHFTGDLSDPDVWAEAMKKADAALSMKYDIKVPATLGRKVADPPSAQLAAASPTPAATGTGSGTGAKTDPKSKDDQARIKREEDEAAVARYIAGEEARIPAQYESDRKAGLSREWRWEWVVRPHIENGCMVVASIIWQKCDKDHPWTEAGSFGSAKDPMKVSLSEVYRLYPAPKK